MDISAAQPEGGGYRIRIPIHPCRLLKHIEDALAGAGAYPPLWWRKVRGVFSFGVGVLAGARCETGDGRCCMVVVGYGAAVVTISLCDAQHVRNEFDTMDMYAHVYVYLYLYMQVYVNMPLSMRTYVHVYCYTPNGDSAGCVLPQCGQTRDKLRRFVVQLS